MMATITAEDAEDVVEQLDKICWQCGGKGSGCQICDTVGTILTDAGREMIAFIARNQRRIKALLDSNQQGAPIR
jgi:uncharacterized metal-binding protein